MKSLREILEMDNKEMLSGVSEYGGFCFKLPVYSNITLVGGNSGTGKTYFMQKMRDLIKLGMLELHNLELSKLHVMLEPSELDYIVENSREQLFMIDRANMMNDKQIEKAQHLVLNNNLFVLFTRYYTPIQSGMAISEFNLYPERLESGMMYFKFDR